MKGYASLSKGSRDLLQAFMGAGNSTGKGRDAGATARYRDAQTRKADLESDQLERSAGITADDIVGLFGVPKDITAQYRDFQETGNYGEQAIPSNPDDNLVEATHTPITETPDALKPFLEKIQRADLVKKSHDMGGGKVHQILDAFQKAQDMNLQDRVMGDDVSNDVLAKGMALLKANPMHKTTSSGITTNQYTGDTNDAAFDRKLKSDAKAKVDAAMARAKIDGGKLPSEAALIEYYKTQGMSFDEAMTAAKSRKSKTIKELAANIYIDAYKVAKDYSEEEDTDADIQRKAQETTISAIRFLNKDLLKKDAGEAKPYSGDVAPEKYPEARKSPKDGYWYIQKDSKWHRVNK